MCMGNLCSSSKPKVSTGPSNIVEHPQGFLSARKRHVSKDRVLLKKMEDLVAAGKQDGTLAKQYPHHMWMYRTE
jgi:hypothetical protein